MTENVNKFNAAKRAIGYKNAMRAVNVAAELFSRNVNVSHDDFFARQNEK